VLQFWLFSLHRNGSELKDDFLSEQELHAHTLEPINSLLEGVDVKDDYDDINSDVKQRKKTVDFNGGLNDQSNHIPRHKRQAPGVVDYKTIDDLLADKNDLELIPDWDGYYIGDVWSAQRSKNRQRLRSRQHDNMNSYAQRPFYQNIDNRG